MYMYVAYIKVNACSIRIVKLYMSKLCPKKRPVL